MDYETFADLLALFEAKLDERLAGDSSDGGLNEIIRFESLKADFIRDHCEPK